MLTSQKKEIWIKNVSWDQRIFLLMIFEDFVRRFKERSIIIGPIELSGGNRGMVGK